MSRCRHWTSKSWHFHVLITMCISVYGLLQYILQSISLFCWKLLSYISYIYYTIFLLFMFHVKHIRFSLSCKKNFRYTQIIIRHTIKTPQYYVSRETLSIMMTEFTVSQAGNCMFFNMSCILTICSIIFIRIQWHFRTADPCKGFSAVRRAENQWNHISNQPAGDCMCF